MTEAAIFDTGAKGEWDSTGGRRVLGARRRAVGTQGSREGPALPLLQPRLSARGEAPGTVAETLRSG